MKNLLLDKPVDEHLKPVKDSDGTSTAVELSTDKVRVKDLEITGTHIGISDDTKLPLAGGTLTGGVGFDQITPTYNSVNTDVNFRVGNKQFVTFGAGNITNMRIYYPAVSGNFTLLLKQDGTGSRTVTNWNAYESDESSADGSATVKFAGGSNPTLTTDANHVDIISFYWDADNEIAYGVATLDFQF